MYFERMHVSKTNKAKFGSRFVILVHEIPSPLMILFAGSGHHFNPIIFVCFVRATACDL